MTNTVPGAAHMFFTSTGVYCGLNITTGLLNEHQLLTRKGFSGLLCTHSSDKTNAQKLEASIKIDVYSYRIDHRRASCSAGVLCRGCWAVTCNMQPSIYWKHLGNSPIAVILYSVHIVALDLLCCHCRRSHLHGIRFLQLCQVTKRSLNKADHCMHWEMATKKSDSRGSHQWNSGCWHWFRIRSWG